MAAGLALAGIESQLDHGYNFLGHRLDLGNRTPCWEWETKNSLAGGDADRLTNSEACGGPPKTGGATEGRPPQGGGRS